MRKGMVAEIVIVIVILAAVGLVTMTYLASDDVPRIAKTAFSSIGDLRDLIAQGILDWLAKGLGDEPLACNGYYPLGGRIESAEDSLFAILEALLPGSLTQSGDVTIDLGTLTAVELDEEGLQVVLTGGEIVYDDGSIRANRSISDDLRFNVRYEYVAENIDAWLRCDAGNLTDELLYAFTDWCAFGKRKVACGSDRMTVISADDITFMLQHATRPADIRVALDRAVGRLNAQFNGTGACGEAPSGVDSGIRCEYVLEELDLDYVIMPYESDGMLGKSVPDTHEAKPFRRSDPLRAWAIPPKRITSRVSDDALGCAEADRLNVTISANPSPIVDDLLAMPRDPNSRPRPLVGEPFNIQAYPTLFINTSKAVTLRATVKCTDGANTLLGQPLVYRFSIAYGAQQYCSPPDDLELTRIEPVCAPCGVPPNIQLEECHQTVCSNPCGFIQACRNAVDWMYEQGQSENDIALRCAGDMTPECIDKALDEMKEKFCDRDMTVTESNVCPQAPECASAFAMICCIVPGFSETCSNSNYAAAGGTDPDGNDCFMDKEDFTGSCIRRVDCSGQTAWQVGQLCVKKKCDLSTNSCVPDSEDEPAYGEACTKSACFKCGDDDGICKIDPDMLGEDCTAEKNDPCNKYTCQYNGPDLYDQGCLESEALIGTDCNSPYSPRDESRLCGDEECVKNLHNGFAHCGWVPKDDPPDTCGSEQQELPCGTGGEKTCTWEKTCTDTGYCVRDQDSEDCGACRGSGGDCDGDPTDGDC